MGLFKKSYVERIKEISERLNEVSLSEDDLILNFRSKVKVIEEYDIEFIKLLKRLSREGYLSEKNEKFKYLDSLNNNSITLDNIGFDWGTKTAYIRKIS